MDPIRRSLMLWGAGAMMLLMTLPVPAGAALDTSGSIICAFTRSYDCDTTEGCLETSADNLGLPPFIKLDMANNKVTPAAGPPSDGGRGRETPIRNIQEADGKLYLQGIERRGWSAVIDKETGRITVAASSDNAAIVLFGRCTGDFGH